MPTLLAKNAFVLVTMDAARRELESAPACSPGTES